jgi:protein-S-isoprenylcysteine O-methyltransferase Ste14
MRIKPTVPLRARTCVGSGGLSAAPLDAYSLEFRMLDGLGKLVSSHRGLTSRLLGIAFLFTVLIMENAHEGSFLSAILFLVGLVLVGAATVGRLWCSLYISGYKDSGLITTGPYSITRNPLYFFSSLGFVGIGFATETVTLGLALALIFLLVYLPVIKREEELLRSKFGAIFDAYCACTPRFLPNLSKFTEPVSYVVNPRIFRNTMGDVIWFVWFVGIIKIVQVLHEHQLLKPLVWLP